MSYFIDLFSPEKYEAFSRSSRDISGFRLRHRGMGERIKAGSRRSLQPETPKSFGGVSGSGLWRFSLAKSSESEIKPLDFQFAGVAFYQLPDTDDGIATVRFHGPRSVYERLLPQVRGWLG
jgi:hypothetical protein